MRKFLLTAIIALLPFGYKSISGGEALQPTISECRALYEGMRLNGVVNFDVFEMAYNGFERIPAKKKEILALVDFSKPSTEERLFLLDIARRELIFSTHVAHGKNSGGNYASSFSNVSGSNKSSLGFYLTDHTYSGRNGYSLLLNGLERGFNDRARERAIVMHGADYADPDVIAGSGRLGRSQGCPAVPREVNRRVIDIIKEGAVMFIYSDDSNYLKNSRLIR